jgi:regulator of nucleoside diphosphate kinase
VHRGRVSVLAPIGSALLGLRVGQSITWRVPTGEKTIRVIAVHYQPEANGEAR